MSINIPDKYSKDEFNKLLNQTLKGDDFSQHKALFKDSFKRNKETIEQVEIYNCNWLDDDDE